MNSGNELRTGIDLVLCTMVLEVRLTFCSVSGQSWQVSTMSSSKVHIGKHVPVVCSPGCCEALTGCDTHAASPVGLR